MNDYDFKSLNDKEFEILVNDLLSAEFNIRIERFKPGKDQGVDGRFFMVPEEEVIIQSKHYLKSGYKVLKKRFAEEEAQKMNIIKPKKYIAATSLELSRKQKEEIKDVMFPYILSESDVYGAEDINDLLKRHPKIEELHYKLWIASTTVLKNIFNAAIKGRSRDLLEEVRQESHKYVITENHNLALERLKDNSVVILLGEPGIGKTIMAKNLYLYHAASDFEVLCVDGDLSEAEASFGENEKQLFYYDDFLGSNYLTALEGREDSRIINFIKRIKRSKNKALILTSRTNIMNQGKRLSDKFHAENIEENELILEIAKISRFDRAKILYNHIYFSDLTEVYIEQLYENNRYLDIIDHKNYNPRIVQFITDMKKLKNVTSEEYWNYVGNTLNNPADVWKNVFEVQIDQACRDMVSLVVFNGEGILEEDLNSAFQALLKIRHEEGLSVYEVDFVSSISILSDALLNRFIESKDRTIWYDLFNPSVGDYVVSRSHNEPDNVKRLFLSLKTSDSLRNHKVLLKNNLLSQELSIEIFRDSLNSGIKLNESIKHEDYYYLAIDIVLQKKEIYHEIPIDNYVVTLVENTNLNDSKFETYDHVLNIIAKYSTLQKSIEKQQRVIDFITNRMDEFDHDQLVTVNYMVDDIDYDVRDDIEQKLKVRILEYWQDNIETEVVESGDVDDICEVERINDIVMYVEETIDSKLSFFLNVQFNERDKEHIAEYVDCRWIIETINPAIQ